MLSPSAIMSWHFSSLRRLPNRCQAKTRTPRRERHCRSLKRSNGSGRQRPCFTADAQAYLAITGEHARAESQPQAGRRDGRIRPASVDDFLDGEAAYQSGDYNKAIQAFRRVLSREPDHFWGRYLLAICHLKAHRPSEAQAALSACQNRRPGFVWTYLLKGFAEGEMREFDLAEDDFSRATDLGLGDGGTLRHAGQSRRDAGPPGSLPRRRDQDFQAAIALRPDQFQAYVDLAQAYQSFGRLDDALAGAQPCDQIGARRKLSFIELEPSFIACGRKIVQAIGDLDRAIKESTDDDPAVAGDHLELALIIDRSGRHSEALAECDRALRTRTRSNRRPPGSGSHTREVAAIRRCDPIVRRLHCARERVRRRCTRPADWRLHTTACTTGRSPITRWPCARESVRLRCSPTGAGLTCSAGQPGRPHATLTIALKSDPSDDRALSGRALAFIQQHKIREALADARASAHGGARDPRLLYNAARVYCQAAVALEARPGRSSSDWVAAGSYRVESLNLIVRSLGLLSEDERSRFWTQVICADTTLEPIRKSKKFLDLEDQMTRTVVRRPSAGAGPR